MTGPSRTFPGPSERGDLPAYEGVPLRLTERGEALRPALLALVEWAAKHLLPRG
jgi:hypothetical protein